MERKELNNNAVKWCCLIASLAFLTVVGGDDNAQSSGTSQCGSNNIQHNFLDNQRLMLVSTLDGKVSALNVEKEGMVEWSVDPDIGPLLSSSISSLEISGKNGLSSRLIPALDGSLYQFDGEEIEAMPFTADTLLSSSFRFSDDSVVVGGKETVTYGIDSVTGKIKYVCSMEGCKRFGQDEVTDNNGILVVERTSKTVRAVEMKTGAENWNFSVGQHEMTFIKTNKRDVKSITEQQSPTNENNLPDEDAWVDPCNTQDEADYFKDFFEWWDQHDSSVNIKVVVPEGLVVAVDKSDPQKILWKHQFKSPISNAWYLKNGDLEKMSLFDDRNVPALENNESSDGSDNFQFPEMPLLYVGKFENQIYVQPSDRMTNEVNKATENIESKVGDVDMPKVRWRPYIATAPSRTPAITHETKEDVSFAKDDESHHDTNQYEVSIWHNHYPFDSGMYLFPDFSPLELEIEDGNTSQYEGFGNEVSVTLWNWWREVLMICIVSSVIVHIVLTKMKKVCNSEIEMMEQQLLSSKESNQTRSESVGSIGKDMPSSPDLESRAREYTSRYETDFEQKECLGRGGFGVVFSATNRVDDCSYAIKRIALNNSDRAKQKVMREVKALAKLDHVGIVRYYQAWFENPPPGWQEERDKSLEDFTSPAPSAVQSDPSTIPSSPITPTTGFHSKDEFIPKETKKTSFYLGDHVANKNPLNPFKADDLLGFSDSESKSQIKKQGSSEGFVPHQMEIDMETETSNDESGSFSLGIGTPKKQNHMEDSIEIEFLDTEDDSNGNIPFDGYKSNNFDKKVEFLDDTNDSFNIVFEDSGCGDHEKESQHKELSNNTYSHGMSTATESDSAWSLAEKGTVGLKFRSHSAASESVKIHKRNRSEPFDTTPVKSSFEHSSSVPNVIRPDTLAIQKLKLEQEKLPNTPVGKLYLFIQMQLCREESLKDWLNSNTLRRDRQQCLDIFDQIVSAVDYVHKCGLMHRDLKPSNIFFAMDGSVKVGDFGLVTATEEQCEDALTPLVGRNNDGRHTDQVGTKLYMSPEQCAGKAYNSMVDIYSLGLIFFELFYPFDTQMERIRTLTEVKKQLFPPRFQRELPEECEFVKSLLSHDPEKRPTACQILQNSLLREFDKARKAVSRISRSRSRTLTSSSQDSG